MLSSIRNGRPAVTSASWLVVLGAMTIGLSACSDSTAPATSSAIQTMQPVFERGGNKPIADEYIVVFKSDVQDVGGTAANLLKSGNGSLHRTYSSAIKGFSAHMSAAQAASATRVVKRTSVTLLVTVLGVMPCSSLWRVWISRRRAVSSRQRCMEPVMRSA